MKSSCGKINIHTISHEAASKTSKDVLQLSRDTGQNGAGKNGKQKAWTSVKLNNLEKRGYRQHRLQEENWTLMARW